MYHIDHWICDVHLVQHSMTDDFIIMDGWRDGIQEWIHTHTACIHTTNYTMYYMYIHVICVCCASNQWVLTDGSHGMDGWGSLQKNHVCLSVGSLPWVCYCKSPLWSSNLVCLSPVSTTAITAATMIAGGGVIAALESYCTSSYFA